MTPVDIKLQTGNSIIERLQGEATGINFLKLIGFISVAIGIVMMFTIILLSFKDTGAIGGVDLWFLLIHTSAYLGGLTLALWRPRLAGLLLVTASIAVGLPSGLINPWAGVIYGVPPLISGLAFILSGMLTQFRNNKLA